MNTITNAEAPGFVILSTTGRAVSGATREEAVERWRRESFGEGWGFYTYVRDLAQQSPSTWSGDFEIKLEVLAGGIGSYVAAAREAHEAGEAPVEVEAQRQALRRILAGWGLLETAEGGDLLDGVDADVLSLCRGHRVG